MGSKFGLYFSRIQSITKPCWTSDKIKKSHTLSVRKVHAVACCIRRVIGECLVRRGSRQGAAHPTKIDTPEPSAKIAHLPSLSASDVLSVVFTIKLCPEGGNL